jgi:hypothetical protein
MPMLVTVHTKTAKNLTMLIFHHFDKDITRSNPGSGVDVLISHKIPEKNPAPVSQHVARHNKLLLQSNSPNAVTVCCIQLQNAGLVSFPNSHCRQQVASNIIHL